MKMGLWLNPAIVILVFMLVNPSRNLGVHCSPETSTNEGIEEARVKFWEAYNATVEAERCGAEVSEAVKKLNNALDYILQAQDLAVQGNMERAFLLTQVSIQVSEETLVLTQELKQQAENLRFTRSIIYIGISIALLLLCVCAFFIGRRLWKRRQQKKFMDMRVKGTVGSE
jgi:uncharacterized membrane protein